jgi:hypothetical protein
LIDWLPDVAVLLDQEFWHELRQCEEAQRMPDVTGVERLGMQKDFEQEQLQAA